MRQMLAWQIADVRAIVPLMTITVPDELINAARLTPEQVRFDLALGLYADRRVTLGKAAALAGMSQSDFLDELGKRRIPVHYDLDDLASDLRTVSVIREKRETEKP
jgi:predicted HTH domain antitoxin